MKEKRNVLKRFGVIALALVLTLAMALPAALVSMNAKAEIVYHVATADEFNYEISAGVIRLGTYKADAPAHEAIEIPATMEVSGTMYPVYLTDRNNSASGLFGSNPAKFDTIKHVKIDDGVEYATTGIVAGDTPCSSLSYMFYACRALESVEMYPKNTTSGKINFDMKGMFQNCVALVSTDNINFEDWNVAPITINNIFQGDEALTDVQNFTSNIPLTKLYSDSGSTVVTFTRTVTIKAPFAGCTALTSADLSGWTPKAADRNGEELESAPYIRLDGIVEGCTALESLKYPSGKITAVRTKDGDSLASSTCTALTTLDLSNSDFSEIETNFPMLPTTIEEVVTPGAAADPSEITYFGSFHGEAPRCHI